MNIFFFLILPDGLRPGCPALVTALTSPKIMFHVGFLPLENIDHVIILRFGNKLPIHCKISIQTCITFFSSLQYKL